MNILNDIPANPIYPPGRVEEIKHNLTHTFFKSRLNVFSDHAGFRPGELHTILGPTGGGKSTLIKTIATELLGQNKKVYFFLSEEDSETYRLPIYEALNYAVRNEDIVNGLLSGCVFDSQFKINPSNLRIENFISRLKIILKEKSCEVVLIDNFTTSCWGGGALQSQVEAINAFRKIADEIKIPVIVALHTKKGTNIYQQLLVSDDVKGHAAAVNMGAYNYSLMTFFNAKPPRVFLHVAKARHHPESNNAFYELLYDKNLKIYVGSKKKDRQEVEEVRMSTAIKAGKKNVTSL